MIDQPAIRITRASAEEVIDLRHAVLRAGLRRDAAIFPGDDDPAARHFVARLPDGRIVGCVTLHVSEWEGEPAFQLRGMAVDPSFQGRGIGGELLRAADDSVRDESRARFLWCNARVPARAFYERWGWQSASDVFEVPTAGPHVRMIKRV